MHERVAILTLNHIGDVLFTEPAIAALRAGYTNATLIVVTSPEAKAVLANHPAIDELWERERTFVGWVRLTLQLRALSPSLVVSFSPSSLRLALASFLSGSPKRFGFSFRPVLKHLFTKTLPFQMERHVVDNYLALAEAAGGRIKRRTPRLFISDEELKIAREKLLKLGWDGLTPLLGCLPFSSVTRKEWGDNNFADLLTWAKKQFGFCPIVFGGGGEKNRAEQIAKQVDGISAAGVLPLRIFIAAASFCTAFIGGDSGPVHLAAALGIPTLVLYGPTDPKRTGPLGERVMIVRSPIGNLKGLPIADVQKRLETLVSKVIR
ncbi:MAG: glycosyltransferase family 9 protein [Candidatus Fervidibacter sp.]|uniref:glycosyltransferase family 9 protein n=1 Tax=Candidatus Fervidibacter sp. TaxID=3100871 RepID=UPI00404AF64A